MRVVVFQRGDAGKHIVEGMKKHSDIDVACIKVNEVLPEIIDKPEDFLGTDFEADLIFDHLHHTDLSEYLVGVGKEKGIPIIVPGSHIEGAMRPRICCSLVLPDEFKEFKFGYPEFVVDVEDGIIKEIKVTRGAPCGATWAAAENVKGMKVEDAIPRIALEVQFLCRARGGYDVAKSKKSPLHLAGDVHKKALERST